MSHGFGVAEQLAAAPEWIVAVFALLTQLGDAWFVFGAVALLYWLGDDRLTENPRTAGALLVALGVCALAATVALKSFFAVHRPPGAGEAIPPAWLPAVLDSVYRSIATGDGFGFPSGHATGATIAYGGAALLYDRVWNRSKRFAAAAGVVAVIALSRLVIGVHLLPDVLAGMVAGLVVLLGTLRLAAGQPDRAFAVATAVAVVALAVALAGNHPGEATKAAIGIGGGLGGFVEWNRYADAERSRVSLPLTMVALPVLGVLWGAVYLANLSLPLSAVGSAVAVAGILPVPRLAAAWGQSSARSSTTSS